MPQCHNATMLQCHNVTMLQCYSCTVDRHNWHLLPRKYVPSAQCTVLYSGHHSVWFIGKSPHVPSPIRTVLATVGLYSGSTHCFAAFALAHIFPMHTHWHIHSMCTCIECAHIYAHALAHWHIVQSTSFRSPLSALQLSDSIWECLCSN